MELQTIQLHRYHSWFLSIEVVILSQLHFVTILCAIIHPNGIDMKILTQHFKILNILKHYFILIHDMLINKEVKYSNTQFIITYII